MTDYYWKLTVRTGGKFDPKQPRVPAGSPRGGQWTAATSDDILKLQQEIRERFPRPVRDMIAGKLRQWRDEQGEPLSEDQVLMYVDAFEMSESAFMKYSEKFGIEDPKKVWKDFDLEQDLADKEARRKVYQLQDAATYKYTDKEAGVRQEAEMMRYEEPYGKNWSDAKNHLEDEYGVSIRIEGTSHMNPAEEHRQYSILANLADRHPAIAKLLRENVTSVVYRPANKTATAEWVPSGDKGQLVVYDHGMGTHWPGASVYVHELGHAADVYMDSLTGLTKLGFGEGRYSSTYGQINGYEDWAEWWVGAFGKGDSGLRNWDRVKYDAARDLFEELGG